MRRVQSLDTAGTMNERLHNLHERLLYTVPAVDRIACALYDAGDDILKTFINSTRDGQAIAGYKFRLSESVSLSALAASGDTRVIDNIPAVLAADRQHSAWVLKQGYYSSYTVPMYENGNFTGMIFFNSKNPKAFSEREQVELCLFSNLINMMIAGEMSALRAISATARIARTSSTAITVPPWPTQSAALITECETLSIMAPPVAGSTQTCDRTSVCVPCTSKGAPAKAAGMVRRIVAVAKSEFTGCGYHSVRPL